MLQPWHRPAHVFLGLWALSGCAPQTTWDGPTPARADEAQPTQSAPSLDALDAGTGERVAEPPSPTVDVRDSATDSEADAEAPDSSAGDPWWAKRNYEDGGCGDRLYYTAPWAPEFDFPQLGIQADWQLERAMGAAASEEPARGTFLYHGVERDDLLLRCKLGGPCQAGGSRLRLSGRSGEFVLHVHLTPGELPPIPEGSEIRLVVSTPQVLTLSDREGALLLSLVRAGGSVNVLSYRLGEFEVQKGPPVCFATQELCNYRLTVHEVVVTRGGQSWQLAPGERMEANGYRVENHFATRQSNAVPEQPSCAAERLEFDSISIVRVP